MTAAPTAPVDIRREFVALLPRLRRFALTLTASVGEADELVRAACSRAIVEGNCPSSDNPAAPWLFRLIRQVSASPVGKRTGGPSARDPGTKGATEQQNAIQAMPRGEASVFLLVEVEGFSYGEAADILDISPGLIAAHLYEARRNFAATAAPAAERWA